MDFRIRELLAERALSRMSTAGTEQTRLECPSCHYVLTEEDRILCQIAGRGYCPHCWESLDAKTPSQTPMDKTTGENQK